MAHFALVQGNRVTEVIVVDNVNCGEPELSYPETETVGIAYLESLGIVGNFKQCSFNGSFRGYYPAIGSLYDEEQDIFVPLHFVNVDGVWMDPKDVPES